MEKQPSADPQGVAAVPPSPAPESTPTGEETPSVSWQALKDRFLGGVQAEGFPGVPEPDSREFAPFLAKLNAKNPALARELVHETRRLRRGLDLPSAAAARRRERSRDTRRVLLMRQTPDGRWVLDKQKAPVYGMLGLLALGGLLTAIYALPKLDGKSAFASTTAAPRTSPDAEVSPAPAPDPASQEALERSREQLRQVRANKTVVPPLSPAASKNPSVTTPSKPKTLTTIKNPPPPPTVPLAPVRSADFQPVVDPARASSGFQPQRGAASSSAVIPQSLSYAPSSAPPEVLPFGVDPVVATRPPEPASTRPAPTPLPSAPARGAQQQGEAPAAPSATPPSSKPAPPVATPRLGAPTAQKPPAIPTSPSLAGTTGPTSATPTPPPVVLKAPGTASAPAVPSPLNVATSDTPATPAPAASDSGEATAPFGGDFSPAPSAASATPQDPSAAPAPGFAASSPTAFARGMVYERKPQAAPADQPTSNATPPPTSTSTGAETPFGSDTANPASKIGATGPFTPLQQIPATLLTGIRTPNGGSVPVVAVTSEGGSFVGVATVNAVLARVDILFRRYIAPDGNIHQIDALAYARDGNGLTQGIPAAVEAFAPTLALDAAQNSANALNTYVQNAAAVKGGSGTTINLGDGNALSGPSAASLAQTLLGGLGATFKMPENTQSILRVASVKSTAPMIVIAGLGGGQ